MYWDALGLSWQRTFGFLEYVIHFTLIWSFKNESIFADFWQFRHIVTILQNDDGGMLQVKATGLEKDKIMTGKREIWMRPTFKTVHIVEPSHHFDAAADRKRGQEGQLSLSEIRPASL